MAHHWYVAQTHPAAEAAAVRRLNRQDFRTYLPILTFRRPVRRGKNEITRMPLFCGYLFVMLETDPEADPGENWKRVNSTRAVASLLPRSDSPLAVPDTEIEKLMKNEAAGNFVFPRGDAMLPGAKLRVDAGSLAGQVVTCLEANDRQGTVRALWAC